MSDQITASHILISHAEASSASANLSREDALAQIEAIKSEIEGGARFADQSQHLATPQSQIDAPNDFMPALIAKAIDHDLLHLQ